MSAGTNVGFVYSWSFQSLSSDALSQRIL